MYKCLKCAWFETNSHRRLVAHVEPQSLRMFRPQSLVQLSLSSYIFNFYTRDRVKEKPVGELFLCHVCELEFDSFAGRSNHFESECHRNKLNCLLDKLHHDRDSFLDYLTHNYSKSKSNFSNLITRVKCNACNEIFTNRTGRFRAHLNRGKHVLVAQSLVYLRYLLLIKKRLSSISYFKCKLCNYLTSSLRDMIKLHLHHEKLLQIINKLKSNYSNDNNRSIGRAMSFVFGLVKLEFEKKTNSNYNCCNNNFNNKSILNYTTTIAINDDNNNNDDDDDDLDNNRNDNDLSRKQIDFNNKTISINL